jgi:hypothetical protein
MRARAKADPFRGAAEVCAKYTFMEVCSEACSKEPSYTKDRTFPEGLAHAQRKMTARKRQGAQHRCATRRQPPYESFSRFLRERPLPAHIASRLNGVRLSGACLGLPTIRSACIVPMILRCPGSQKYSLAQSTQFS